MNLHAVLLEILHELRAIRAALESTRERQPSRKGR